MSISNYLRRINGRYSFVTTWLTTETITWRVIHSKTYSESVSGVTIIPPIMWQCLRWTMTGDTTIVMPTVVSGGGFLLQIANADEYTLTIPSGVIYPEGLVEEFNADCLLLITEQGGDWLMEVLATEIS